MSLADNSKVCKCRRVVLLFSRRHFIRVVAAVVALLFFNICVYIRLARACVLLTAMMNHASEKWGR